MSVRLRRLKADYEKISSMFSANSRIRVLKTLGNPPEKYQIEFLVGSLQEDPATQKLRRQGSFLAEIALTSAYPRMAPQCKMLTPVFHPNIAPHAICIGDHWAAGESLPHLIVRIAEMLAFQSYNIKSPLNGEAAKWVEHNRDRLPVDTYDFASLLSVGEAVARKTDGTLQAGNECANCGARSVGGTLQVCFHGHVACPNCRLSCALCGCVLCLKCPTVRCAATGRTLCPKCSFRCPSCSALVARDRVELCHVCGLPHCGDCLVSCASCGKSACLQHIHKKIRGEQRIYLCSRCEQGGR